MKEQYVMSEEDGKATGWSAHFEGSEWIETQPKVKKAKAKAKAKPKAKAKAKAKAKPTAEE